MATMGRQKSLLFGVGFTGMVVITTIGFVAAETAEAVTIKGIAKAQERVSLPSQTLKAVDKRKIKKSPRGNLPILVEEAEDYDFLPDVAVEEGVGNFGNARVTVELPNIGDNGITGMPTSISGDDTNALELRETGRGGLLDSLTMVDGGGGSIQGSISTPLGELQLPDSNSPTDSVPRVHPVENTPEPVTILGTGLALGLGILFKQRQSRVLSEEGNVH